VTTRTSPSLLLVLAVAAGLLVNLLLGLFYGSLPRLPGPAGVTFLVLGVAEGITAFVLYRRIQRRPGARPVDALAAARAVALAKASALAGALVGGAWCGVLAYVLPRRAQVEAAASDTTAAVVGIIGAAVLVAAALVLEWCCRTPDDQDAPPTPDR
jgi:ABC-type Co2+ transport system permease subunit